MQRVSAKAQGRSSSKAISQCSKNTLQKRTQQQPDQARASELHISHSRSRRQQAAQCRRCTASVRTPPFGGRSAGAAVQKMQIAVQRRREMKSTSTYRRPRVQQQQQRARSSQEQAARRETQRQKKRKHARTMLWRRRSLQKSASHRVTLQVSESRLLPPHRKVNVGCGAPRVGALGGAAGKRGPRSCSRHRRGASRSQWKLRWGRHFTARTGGGLSAVARRDSQDPAPPPNPPPHGAGNTPTPFGGWGRVPMDRGKDPGSWRGPLVQ